MDPLLVIVAAASAILFSYLGYLAGNYFPLIRRDPNSGQTAAGEKIIDTLKEFLNQMIDSLKEPESSEEGGANDSETTNDMPEKTTAPVPLKTKEPQMGNPQETIQVWHDRESSRVIAQIKGKQYDLDDPISSDVHGRLSMLMIDLQEKVGIGAEIKEKFTKQVEKADELRKPSFNPIKSFINYVQADVPDLEEKTDSIPAQVNNILQQQLKGTPLEVKGISMGEWPGRGVVFIVGLDIYDDITDIPDEAIRSAIHSAVRKWEAKHAAEDE